MPALLIVNPHATATSHLRRDVITHALASQMDLEVVETRYRGHAGTLARQAASDGFELILTLGGDGTVNEAINGLIRGARGGRDGRGGTDPAFAPIPAGNANVFTRALGLPADPVDAAGGSSRPCGLAVTDASAWAAPVPATPVPAPPQEPAWTATSPSTPGWAWMPKRCGRSRVCERTAAP